MDCPQFWTSLLLLGLVVCIRSQNAVWRWQCVDGFCQKKEITPDTQATALSLQACRIFCSHAAAIWPKPSGTVTIGNYLAKININSIDVLGIKSETRSGSLASGAVKHFKNQIQKLLPKQKRTVSGGKSLEITVVIKYPNKHQLTLDTDESYSLRVSETTDGRINATIAAETVFGSRHGLETLSQIIIYDDIRSELQIPRDFEVNDRPAYPYRGILLDTSRNYIDVDSIKRTIDAMGSTKMNRFHWHITDSHSFPYVSKTHPRLSQYGAYTPSKVYTPEDVAEIVQFGLERGVKVVPEFDAPAHVGEGWQNTGFVTCFNWKPWQSYCVEPPCGQLDPTKPELYNVLEGLYGDMLEQFQPDIFHMGGDEVNFNCWNSTPGIVDWMKKEKGWGRNESDFVQLWDMFQSEALSRLYKKAGQEIPVIMWTSTLTHKDYLHFLPKDKYIIQIWTTGDDPQVSNLLQNGYKIIISNYDSLYFDCGFAGWVTDGNNWCSPYIGWQKVYENTPAKIAGDKKSQVLGSEATLWTEQADSANVDSRLWPRAAALGEVLWSEPKGSWRDAESRLLIHRDRLINRGVNADALEPEWCMHYEDSCPMNGKFNS